MRCVPPRIEIGCAAIGELAQLDDAHFRDIFRGSGDSEHRRDRFMRNVLIAIGNSGRRDTRIPWRS